ncbi:hypothetical protein [Rubrivirga marina]|uniref:DUF2383 domain-containing protein n=1 Tax=Rubrivirga marina TaxID=1196024 RepID=A0A271IZX3_9BACT|nr:hypothetical protein [Rubrivirga marina]PAP76627.1 hypothetical protein BSZ37_09315 [Rubrivirga marina]
MFPALRPILNKGGAGRYISREESVERLRPVAERHLDLLQTYQAALARMADGPAKERVEAMMPYLRTETAKISETILSLGGAPPTGAGREAFAVVEGSDRNRVQGLLDAENDFGGMLREEVDAVHHQERTRAILGHNAEASTSRIDLLRGVAADLPR